MNRDPQVLGLRRSFGFGDRLGCAGRGHLRAVTGSTFSPILAQQSIRELTRTGRTAGEVLEAARQAITAAEYHGSWGADADHLQTTEDARSLAEAGYTFFTIDPSNHLREELAALDETDPSMIGDEGSGLERYAGKVYDIDGEFSLEFDRGELRRIMAKWRMALVFVASMHDAVRMSMGTRPFELELSVDETRTPTSHHEHLYLGMELRRLGIELTCLAPRFVGQFEKGIDYRGDLQAFEQHYAGHAAIARFCGPYKLSLHSGSDKFSVYPSIGRLSGDLLHVKTAGTSYLEALRVAARQSPDLLREIIGLARQRFVADCATYEISSGLDDAPARCSDAELEPAYLDSDAGRQILHVTYGSVLTENRGRFRNQLLELLDKEGDLHQEVLETHLGKHIRLLESEG